MGDKGKGKDSGKGKSKKPKNETVGRRPHEEREREALQKQIFFSAS